MRAILAAIALLVLAAFDARAQPLPEFRVVRAAVPPRIDGTLDDAVWQTDPLPLTDWISYNPLRGEKATERTEVRIAYDDRNIYFAFHCYDSEPDKVRTTVSRRDDAFNDDWVALSLDSTSSGQTAYHLFVNPSGVQMDAVNTASAGERFETDLVWWSAGRRTDDGYVVEMAIPLQTIRFANGTDVRMGILFFRHISRTGKSFSWPDMPPGQWVFNRHAHLIFGELHQRRLVEVLPSLTFPLSQTRDTPQRWNELSGKLDAGVSGKLGITSTVTLDATVNPDFSQVESDAFQVQVNQRFPVFFSEKRPFFMEGLGFFNTAAGNSNMQTAVHTRRIVDPSWGAKLIGSQGHLSFGLLNASDEHPADDEGRPETLDESKFFTVGRAQYAFGGSDYVGGLFTDTEHAGRRNQVVGADGSRKLTTSQQVSASAFYTKTTVDGVETHGASASANYEIDTKRFFTTNQFEHYDTDFRMDTAFYNHTGFTSGLSYGDVNFYPDSKQFGLIRWHPFVLGKYSHDVVQQGNERFIISGIKLHFLRQGFVDVERQWGEEPFAGDLFKTNLAVNSYAQVQAFRWLNVGGNFTHGWAPYYDAAAPYQGRITTGGIFGTWQPNQHFNESLNYNGVHFDRADTGQHVYTVHVVNSKTVYQFNRHFLVRLLEQFDNSNQQLLTDVLGSYEFVPGTVVFAGYGSLLERRLFVDGHLVPGTAGSDPGNYLAVSRGLFFKASYLHRF